MPTGYSGPPSEGFNAAVQQRPPGPHSELDSDICSLISLKLELDDLVRGSQRL